MSDGKTRKTEVISLKSNKINILAQSATSKTADAKQAQLDLEVEKDIGGMSKNKSLALQRSKTFSPKPVFQHQRHILRSNTLEGRTTAILRKYV